MKNVLKSLTVAALALALVSPIAANAAPQKGAPKAAPQVQTEEKAKQPTYAEKKAAAVEILTQFRDALNTLPVDQLNAELAKLPAFEKAYIEAKGKNDEAAAKAAADGYATSFQTIVQLNGAIGQAMSGTQMVGMQLGMMLGNDAEKIAKEKEFTDVSTQVDARMAAIQAAGKASNDAVGALYQAVGTAVKQRMQIESKKIFTEELNNAVVNHMQTKLAE